MTKRKVEVQGLEFTCDCYRTHASQPDPASLVLGSDEGGGSGGG